MRIIEKVSEMQQQADLWRQERKRIAFVPTMGFLHDGHLALMRKARQLEDVVVVSIFVNPTQFGPGEDFASYPRDMERDLSLMEGLGVEVVFAPTAEEMYPKDYQTVVDVTRVTQALCGRSRPGHFRGVTTVVAKLFHIVKPHTAVFGEKDFQQLVTIRKVVEDLNMDVRIVGHPIVREEDGLAMSSRNTYLSLRQRLAALHLNRSLKEAQRLVSQGERLGKVILDKVIANLQAGGEEIRIDYVELCDPVSLENVEVIEGSTLLALAAHVGKARLIDNCLLTPPK